MNSINDMCATPSSKTKSSSKLIRRKTPTRMNESIFKTRSLNSIISSDKTEVDLTDVFEALRADYKQLVTK